MIKNVIIYADSDKSAPFRYRCSNFVEVMEDSEQYSVKCFVGEEYPLAKEALLSSSILVIERQSDKTGRARQLIKEARRLKIPVVYSVDDLVFSPRHIPLLMKSTHSKNILYWSGYVFGNYRLARLADAFTTTNQFLANKLQKEFNKPAYVIPNFLNSAQITISEKILAKKSKNQNFTIGYFSGSPTHYNDFLLIKPELLRFLKTHDSARLHIVGDMKIDSDMNSFIKSGQIQLVKKVDYKELQKLYSSVDVNIAPLVENDFTNCKSELKFFEAAIVEVLTLASPTFAFKNSIKNGETGFLCKKGEWFDCLEDLFAHPEKRKKIAKAAKKYCLENYYGEKIKKQIEEVYDELAK